MLEIERNQYRDLYKRSHKAHLLVRYKYQELKGDKQVRIRQNNIDRMLAIDSNLNRLVNESVLNAKYFWQKMRVKPEGLEVCPIDNKVVQIISMYLRSEYENKEYKIKEEYHFKEDDL